MLAVDAAQGVDFLAFIYQRAKGEDDFLMNALKLPAPFIDRFIQFDGWLQAAFVVLALLLLALSALILRSAVSFTHSVLKPAARNSVARSKGWVQLAIGLALAAVGIVIATSSHWLSFVLGFTPSSADFHASHIALAVLAASLYAISEGAGVVMFGRPRVGVMLLVWAMLIGVARLVATVF